MTSSRTRLWVVGAPVVVCLLGCTQRTNATTSEPETQSAAKPSFPATGEPDLTTGSVSFDAAAAAELEVKRAPTGHLLVKPVINGMQPGWFIFDTGAGICVISTPHAAEFALRDAGSIDAVGVGGAASKKLWRAETLTLGPVTLRDHAIMTTDFSFLKQHLGEEIYGVVGYGVLAASVVELDIAAPRIAIHDPAGFTLERGEWQALDVSDRIPVVRAKFEDHDGQFRLDTGADGHVTFHQPAVKKWKLLEGRELTEAKLGGVGGFVNAKKGEVAWFELGGQRRERVPAQFALEAKGTFADSKKDGNIGAELLRPFVLVFDYAGSRIAFVPHTKRDAEPSESGPAAAE